MDEVADLTQVTGISEASTQLRGFAKVETLLRHQAIWASPPAELESRVMAGLERLGTGDPGAD